MEIQKKETTDSARNVADCSLCYYSWKANVFDGGQLWACDYIGIENKRRPCPFGPGCTVFKPKKNPRQYTAGWFHEGRKDD